ncbi:hypothetical protein [Embleya sp. AB8]|uniref:hypothetical protein n=1 Tax=Embleya sp. AB8 TaxID=3156304 RepID=UPI003C7282B4
MRINFKSAAVAGALALATAVTTSVVTASPAYAGYGCTGGDGCNHQTGIAFDDSQYVANKSFWGPFTVLKIQTDGNFVLYCQGHGSSRAVWASGINVNPIAAKVIFQRSGNISTWQYHYSTHDYPVWDATWISRTDYQGSWQALVQADGNFVIYNNNRDPIWSSQTYHACPGTEGYWG